MSEVTKEQIIESTKRLKELLPEDSDVYAIVKRVARSGMSRHIDFYTFKTDSDGKIQKWWLTRHMANIGIGSFNNDTECLRISGCGMDMCFHAVYSLSNIIHGDGYKLNKVDL